jgi:N-acetyl-gamma-glutamyl-phosphate reductase
MGKPRLFIDGEAGTTGLQIRARLAGRDDLILVSIDPGQRKDDRARARLLNDVDLAVLCLPDQAAKDAVAMVENDRVKILDASTAFRVAPDWTYGFAELTRDQTESIRQARFVSNPGCYPTGALALLRPLLEGHLLPADLPVTINAISGYSGGGRQMISSFEGAGPNPTTEPFFLYGLDLAHKHRGEMRMHAGLTHTPLFVPSVGRFAQGMLVSIPLALWSLPGRPSGAQFHAALQDYYRGQRFIEVMEPMENPANLQPEALNGSNMLQLFVFTNPVEETALLVARLDNLGKGASGAACQNIDLMLGLDRPERLYSLPASRGR